MTTTVAATIQQIPTNPTDDALQVREIEATAENYLDAVAKVEANVPDGWRVLAVRTVDPTPNTTANA